MSADAGSHLEAAPVTIGKCCTLSLQQQSHLLARVFAVKASDGLGTQPKRGWDYAEGTRAWVPGVPTPANPGSAAEFRYLRFGFAF